MFLLCFILFYQITVNTNTYHNAIAIKEITSKIQTFFVLQITFVSLKFVGTVLVPSKISPRAITESSIIQAKYLPFSKLNAAALQI